MTAGLLIRSLRVLGVIVLLSATTGPSAHAEPITVTSGQLTVAWDHANSFQFFGANGFALSGLFFFASSPQQACFTGCLVGTIVNLSAVAGGAGSGSTLGLSLNANIHGVDWVGQLGNHLTWPGRCGSMHRTSCFPSTALTADSM